MANKVNWELLRQQKLTLVELRPGDVLTADQRANLDGILHLIDAFQDDAVASGEASEGAVFGGEPGASAGASAGPAQTGPQAPDTPAIPAWLTPAQVKSIDKLFARSPDGSPDRAAFFARVQEHGVGPNLYAGITWSGIFVGIEQDGEAHS